MCKVEDAMMLLFLVLCSISDLRTRRISTMLLLIMSLFTILLSLFLVRREGAEVAGGVLVGVIFWLISKYSNEAIGYGDSWIMSLMGIYLGGRYLLEITVIAFFLAGLVSLVGITLKKWRKSVKIPFVPLLTAAYLGVILR